MNQDDEPKDWTDAFPIAEKHLKAFVIVAAIVQPYVGF